MFWKTLGKVEDQATLIDVVAGIQKSEVKDYDREVEMCVSFVFERKVGIGPAREAVRKEALRLYPKAKYFLWVDDKTSVKKGLMRGLEILKKKKDIGIVCGTSDLIRFFTPAKSSQKLWGATLMWVRRDVMQKNKFLMIRSYEDKAFMLGAIKQGYKIANDYKMDYTGPRHLKGGTSSHRGLDKRHVEYTMRVLKRECHGITKMTLKKKKDKGVWAISLKYSDEVLKNIVAIGG